MTNQRQQTVATQRPARPVTDKHAATVMTPRPAVVIYDPHFPVARRARTVGSFDPHFPRSLQR